MEKEKVTPIRWHIYHVVFSHFITTPRVEDREFLLLFLNRDHLRKHFGIIASTEEISNDTLDLYNSYTFYAIKEVTVKDLPLYINWHQKPIFSRLLKNSTIEKGTFKYTDYQELFPAKVIERNIT